MTLDLYGLFLNGFLTGIGLLLSAIVTNPATLAAVALLVLLAVLNQLVPSKRRRGRRR